MRRTVAGLGAALMMAALAPGCAFDDESVAAERRAIRDGSAAPDDAAVAVLVPRRAECDEIPFQVLCTATLIDDDLVLTAGHCVDAHGPGLLEVFFGAGLGDPDGEYRVVSDMILHPRYSEIDSDFDLALLRLDEPVSAAPVELFRDALDASWIGRRLRVVGFGEQDDSNASSARRQGTVSVTSVEANTFAYAPDPAMTCRGDSGGPAFVSIDDVEYLVGVTSAGDPACATFGVDARVDPAVDDFITPTIAAGPPATDPSDRECASDASSDGGGCAAVRGGRPSGMPLWFVLAAIAALCPRGRRAWLVTGRRPPRTARLAVNPP